MQKLKWKFTSPKMPRQVDEKKCTMPDNAGMAYRQVKHCLKLIALTCHLKAGEGGTGPNLTDDYWIHKGSFNDIYHVH